MTKQFDLSLYLILDPGLCSAHSMAETARLAAQGGATMVQLRDKSGGTEAMITAGRAIRAALAGTGVPLIVNDDVAAAQAIGAEGVHLGQSDMAIAQARAGCWAPTPLSALSVTNARRADPSGGPRLGRRCRDRGGFRDADTRRMHDAPMGLDGSDTARGGLTALATAGGAIGGITTANAAAVMAGRRGRLAVIGAMSAGEDVEVRRGVGGGRSGYPLTTTARQPGRRKRARERS